MIVQYLPPAWSSEPNSHLHESLFPFVSLSNETANEQHLSVSPPWSEISFFRSESNPIINEKSSPVDLRSVCAIFLIQ